MPPQTVSNSDPLVPAHQALSEGLAQAITACQTLTDQVDPASLAPLWQQLQTAQEALERYTEALQPTSTSEAASAIATLPSETLAIATPQLPKVITDCQQLFEISTDAIIWLENGVFIDCNQATVQLMGYAHKAELLGKSPVALSPEVQPDGMPSLQKAQEILPLVLQQGSHRFEWMHQRTNGDRFWVEILLTAIDSNGRQLIHGIWRDITDYKVAEAERSEQEQILRSTYEGVDHCIALVDVTPEGDFYYLGWNPATATRTGIPNAMAMGQTPEEVFGAEPGAHVRQSYQRCVEVGEPMTYEEFLPLQGQGHWWLTTLNPLKDEHGQIYRIVVTAVDITDRKATETALEQQEYQYRSVFESINDGIFIQDINTGELIAVNPATCKMHGYTYDEFVQLNPSDYAHPDSSSILAQFVETIKAGQRFRAEAVDLHKDGTSINIEVTGIPFNYGDRLCVLSVVRDISDRKRLEAEQQQAEATLKDANSFLTSVLEALPGLFFAKDREGKYITVNSNLANFFQQSTSAVIGKSEFDFFSPEVAKSMIENDQAVMIQGVLQRFEEVAPTSSSESAIYLSTKAPIYNAAGEVVGVLGLAQDISDLKAMEASLRESEQRFRDVSEAAGEYIWELSLEGVYTFITEQAKAVKGYSSDQLLGHTPFEFMLPEDISRVEAIVKTAAANKSVFQLEHRNVLPSGEVVWEAVSGVPSLDEAGEMTGFRGAGLSINERKLAEAAIAESEAKFRRLIENASDLIYAADAENRFTYLSPQFTEMWGHPVEDFTHQSFVPLIHPDDLPIAFNAVQVLFATGKRQTNIEFRTRHQDGTFFWITCSITPVTNDQGQVISYQGIARDISDRKAFEETQSRLTAILDATSDFVGISNTDGEQLYMNPAGHRLLEIPPDLEIVGRPLDAHLPERAKTIVLEEGIPTAIRAGIWQGETALVTHTGREFPVSQVIIAHQGTDGDVEYLSTIVRDITVQKQAEVALQQKAEELEQTLGELQRTQLQMIQSEKMSSLGQLVAGVAHEINNPVGFIHGNIAPMTEYTHDLINLVELYQQEYSTPNLAIQDRIDEIDWEFLKEDSPKILTSIQVGTERIRQIVGSLKNFSRLDEAECKEADIHAGIDSTLLILEHRIKATPERPAIQIEKDYGDLPLVNCYPGQLNQVFMNILANALDALDQRDRDRSLEAIKQHPSVIKVQTQRVGSDRVVIRIEDNGPGISEQLQQRIFDPFFTTKPVGKGTGIGMSISHQIITEKHGGTLHCFSVPGQGAQFTIEIPCLGRPSFDSHSGISEFST